jgi:hypothetical protein
MARINEKGAGKAPRHKNAATRTAGGYRRAQASKLEPDQDQVCASGLATA